MKKTIIALVAFFLMLPVALMANGTVAGTSITNTVTASYSNLGNTAYSTEAYATNSVQAIFGLSSSFSNTVTKFVAPGFATTFAMTVTNKGNSPVVISLSNYRIATGGASSWYQNFYLTATTNGQTPIKSLLLAEDATATVYLYVHADAAAVDGHSRTNVWGSAISNKAVYNAVYNLAPLTGYTGMDGLTFFGGRDNITNYLAIAVVQAPNIQVTKRFDVTNSISYMALAQAANWKSVVPGSELVYVITWTNAGSGTVKGLTFTDPIKPEFEYVPNSLTYHNDNIVTADYFAAWQANVTATRTLADNGSTPAVAGAPNYGLTGSANTGSIIFGYTENIPGGSKGTLMYKVRVR